MMISVLCGGRIISTGTSCWSLCWKQILMTLAISLRSLFCQSLPPWWYCVRDKYLPLYLSIEKTINPDQVSNSICRNEAPNVQGTSTIHYCCLQTLLYLPPALRLANCLLLQPNISHFDLSVQSICSRFSAPHSLSFGA